MWRVGHRSGGGRGRVIDALPAEDCLQGYEQLPGCKWTGDLGGRNSTENLIPRPPFQRMLCEPVGTTARSGEHFYSNFLVLYCSGGHHSRDDKLAVVLLSWPWPSHALSKPSLSRGAGPVKCRRLQRQPFCVVRTGLAGQNATRENSPGRAEHPQFQGDEFQHLVLRFVCLV